MPGTKQAQREYVLSVLRRKGQEAETLVGMLRRKFPDLDEEQAGELVWGLIDARVVRVNDDAELEASDQIAS
jgi:hypothetical protein